MLIVAKTSDAEPTMSSIKKVRAVRDMSFVSRVTHGDVVCVTAVVDPESEITCPMTFVPAGSAPMCKTGCNGRLLKVVPVTASSTEIVPVKGAKKVNTMLDPEGTTDVMLELTSVPEEENERTRETDVTGDAKATVAVRDAPSPTMVRDSGKEVMFDMF
jgi:hypothetical protein